MTYALSPSGVVNVLAGVALVALGLYLLRLRLRTPAALAFCAFAVAWGLQIATANVYDMTRDPAVGRFWLYAFLFLIVPLYVPLLYLVSAYPSPRNALGRSPVALGVLAAPAAFLLLLFATWPGVLVADVRPLAASLLTVPGPLYWPVTVWNGMLAFAVALVLVIRNLADAEGRVPRMQLALLASALFAYVSYRAADVLVVALVADALARDAGLSAVLLYLTGAVGAAGATAWGLSRVARMREAPLRSLMVACGTVPLVVGLLEAVLRIELGVAGFRTAGLWRFMMVGIFAYAVAKYRLFDLDVRLRKARVPATYVALVLFGCALLWGLFATPLSASPVLALTATGGLAAFCYPLARAVQARVDGAVPASADTAYAYRRKLEVYAAALAELRARRGHAQDEARFLHEFRDRLDVTDDEHRFLLALLRAHAPEDGARRGPSERFRVVRELGRGAAGRALLARDGVLNRDVVLKQPLVGEPGGSDTRARVLREARLAAKVTHPNVVSVFEVLADDDPPVLVMEYVTGGTLHDELRARGRTSIARGVAVAQGILAGLGALHAHGIVHRDLKPANVLLDAEGAPKITDFGVARDAAPDHDHYATYASPSSQPGTPAYMSPEQVRGDAVGPETDVYAVGVILYRCLTGQHYLEFKGVSERQARERIQAAPPRDPPPGTMPPAIAPVIAKALAKTPRDRYASATEMAAALARAAEGVTEDPAPEEAVGAGPVGPDAASLQGTEVDPTPDIPDGARRA